MATFDLSNKVNIVNPSASVDAKYGPWASLSEAKTNVVLAVREKGLTVGIIENEAVVEYWWKAGTANDDLVLKTGGSSGDSHTHANKTTLDKIGESAGIPTWNGSAWPGGGGAALDYSTDIETDKASTTKVSAIKTLYDWAVAKFAAAIHSHTKADVGLGNVDNTSDANKPVSTATQTALNSKSDTTHNHTLAGLTEKSYNSLTDKPTIPAALDYSTNIETDKLSTTKVSAIKTLYDWAVAKFAAAIHSHTKADVGLGNVDNTSDANKPVSTATQTALDSKSDTTHNHTLAGLTEKSYNSLTDKPTMHTHSNKSVLDEIQVALTNELKNAYDDAYTHADSTHAPANAQANVIESVKVNGVALVPDANKEVSFSTSPAYLSEVVTSPTTGILTLKKSTETYLNGTLTNANVFTVVLPATVSGQVNESILIFKTGANLPTITQPTGLVWRGSTPSLGINQTWTICYEQVFNGTDYFIYAIAIKNV